MDLNNKIKNAPDQPGCYLFKDKNGTVIYVGKSKRLCDRVKQYFLKSNQQECKTITLAKVIKDVEFRVTNTELDALIMEYYLIKHYRPSFNVQHKSDREVYYGLVLRETGRYPSFQIVRREEQTTGIMGCFRSENRARDALFVLNRVWKLPLCMDDFSGKCSRGCLHNQMQTCMAPCTGQADQEKYSAAVQEVCQLFKGEKVSAYKECERRMREAADELAFEKAAEYKKLITDLDWLRHQSRYAVSLPNKGEVIIFMKGYGEDCFSLFYSLDGRVYVRQEYETQSADHDWTEFIDKIKKIDENEEGDGKLALCLRNISADKLYVVMERRWKKARLNIILQRSQCLFTGKR